MADVGEGLAGRRVLIVDDETYVAMMLEDMLQDLGCTVVGVAQNLDAGLELARRAEADVAVLDVNVGGKLITPVAQTLDERGIPLLFSTGYGAAGLGTEWRGRPVLPKPFAIEDLARALRQALAAPNATD